MNKNHILILVCICFFTSCSKEYEVSEESIFKNNIVLLAKKYNLKVNFNVINNSFKSKKINDLNEVETLFKNFCTSLNQEQKSEIRFYKETGVSYSVSKKTKQINKLDEWLFNLTYLEVTIKHNKNFEVTKINAFFSGASIYTYEMVDSDCIVVTDNSPIGPHLHIAHFTIIGEVSFKVLGAKIPFTITKGLKTEGALELESGSGYMKTNEL